MAHNDVNAQLVTAARNGDANMVRDLVQTQGADPEAVRVFGDTPIYMAARYGHVEVVRALGELGADPNAMTDDGETAIFSAARFGYVEVVRALGELGADPNLARARGETPIFMAARAGFAEVVRVLGELGADPNLTRTNDGETPIFWAAWYGHVEVVRVLGELGADPNLARPDDGTTPIFWAAWYGHMEVVRALLELGAARHIADSFGKTPLDKAVECGNAVMQRLLATPVPQPHRTQIRVELDDKIEEIQIIELVADFVGPMCDLKRRKMYIAECPQHRADLKKKKKKECGQNAK